jgi:hypothetical protein
VARDRPTCYDYARMPYATQRYLVAPTFPGKRPAKPPATDKQVLTPRPLAEGVRRGILVGVVAVALALELGALLSPPLYGHTGPTPPAGVERANTANLVPVPSQLAPAPKTPNAPAPSP